MAAWRQLVTVPAPWPRPGPGDSRRRLGRLGSARDITTPRPGTSRRQGPPGKTRRQSRPNLPSASATTVSPGPRWARGPLPAAAARGRRGHEREALELRRAAGLAWAARGRRKSAPPAGTRGADFFFYMGITATKRVRTSGTVGLATLIQGEARHNAVERCSLGDSSVGRMQQRRAGPES
jgi:hypothetical protein